MTRRVVTLESLMALVSDRLSCCLLRDNIVGVATASGLQYFTYRIAVVDLDIKAFQRIQKYFLEDIAVVDHFTSKFNTA